MRTIQSWEEVIKNKNDYAIAKLIIEDLIGYRKTSLRRADDIDNLSNALMALSRKKKENE